MTTKEQERKALEQIKKIVAGLGEDSYIATAFEGCFDLAERNIDEDAAYSMKGRWEYSEKEREAMCETINRMGTAALASGKRIKELEETITNLDKYIQDLKEDMFRAQESAMAERKDVVIETTDGERDCSSFSKIEFHNNDGFRFINVVQKSGWTTSYKIDDLKVFTVE